MEQELMKAEDFADLLNMIFYSECIEISTNNCGAIQTEQMKRIFVSMLEGVDYPEVTEEMMQEFNRRIDDFRRTFKEQEATEA